MLSWYVVWFVAYCTRLELLTKMFAARDHKVARYSLPATLFLVMLFLLYGNLYLGAAARVTVWNEIGNPDRAFPALVLAAAGPVLAAVALTGIASAAMSTTDSLLLMSGAAIAHDFLRRSVHEPRGIVKDESHYLRVSRYTIVVVGFIALLGSMVDVALILQIVSYAVGILGATFFFPLLVGLTSRRMSREAATASSVSGFVTTCVWTWGALTGSPWAQGVHPIIPGLVVGGFLMLLVARFTEPVRAEGLRKFFPEGA
jgi:Na+/proline symporter